jgi:hypothetical protein
MVSMDQRQDPPSWGWGFAHCSASSRPFSPVLPGPFSDLARTATQFLLHAALGLPSTVHLPVVSASILRSGDGREAQVISWAGAHRDSLRDLYQLLMSASFSRPSSPSGLECSCFNPLSQEESSLHLSPPEPQRQHVPFAPLCVFLPPPLAGGTWWEGVQGRFNNICPY